MADQDYTFTQARTRLEEIVTQVRSKDLTLEKSLDLLEEGVKLANTCTELSDHTEWRNVVEEQGSADDGAGSDASAATTDELDAEDTVATVDAAEPRVEDEESEDLELSDADSGSEDPDEDGDLPTAETEDEATDE